jgi:hypothetical protein
VCILTFHTLDRLSQLGTQCHWYSISWLISMSFNHARRKSGIIDIFAISVTSWGVICPVVWAAWVIREYTLQSLMRPGYVSHGVCFVWIESFSSCTRCTRNAATSYMWMLCVRLHFTWLSHITSFNCRVRRMRVTIRLLCSRLVAICTGNAIDGLTLIFV